MKLSLKLLVVVLFALIFLAVTTTEYPFLGKVIIDNTTGIVINDACDGCPLAAGTYDVKYALTDDNGRYSNFVEWTFTANGTNWYEKDFTVPVTLRPAMDGAAWVSFNGGPFQHMQTAQDDAYETGVYLDSTTIYDDLPFPSPEMCNLPQIEGGLALELTNTAKTLFAKSDSGRQIEGDPDIGYGDFYVLDSDGTQISGFKAGPMVNQFGLPDSAGISMATYIGGVGLRATNFLMSLGGFTFQPMASGRPIVEIGNDLSRQASGGRPSNIPVILAQSTSKNIIFGDAGAGLFRLSIYMRVDTPNTAGNVVCNVNWNDHNNISGWGRSISNGVQGSPVTMDTSGHNFSQGSVIIASEGNTSINVIFTVTQTTGTATYSGFATLEALTPQGETLGTAD